MTKKLQIQRRGAEGHQQPGEAELVIVPLSVHKAALARAEADKRAIHQTWERRNYRALTELKEHFLAAHFAAQTVMAALYALENTMNSIASFAEGAGSGARLSAYCAQTNAHGLNARQKVQQLAGDLHAAIDESKRVLDLPPEIVAGQDEMYAPVIALADDLALAAERAAKGDCSALIALIDQHNSEARAAFFARLREAVSEGGRPRKTGRDHLAELMAPLKAEGLSYGAISRRLVGMLGGKTDDLSNEALRLLTHDQNGKERPYEKRVEYLSGVWAKKGRVKTSFDKPK